MIKPIDLQTLFVKLNDVGKEQVQIKEQAALQQSQEASRLVQREIARDHSVSETVEEKEADPVRDRQENERRRRNRDQEENTDEAEGEEKPEKASDPALGKHIDITG